MNGTQIIIVSLAIAAIGALAYGVIFSKQKPSAVPGHVPTTARVTFDSERITCEVKGRKMELLWEELIGVAIETTDQGPALDDAFFILAGQDGALVCPSEADGAEELLARLQQIPGFNHEAVISAMSCTENRTFICWDKKGRHNKAMQDIGTGSPNPDL